MTSSITKFPALEQLKRGLGSGVIELANELAATAPHQAKVKRRVKERPEDSKQKATAKVIFAAPGAWVEFGIKAHDETPKKARAIKLPNGKFAHKVHHPGVRPQPFINPTLISVISRSSEIIARGVKKDYQ